MKCLCGALWRYAVAAIAVAAALIAHQALVRVIGHFPPFITFYPAIMLIAVLAGFGPGLLAALLAGLAAAYWVLPPEASFAIARKPDAIAWALFLVLGVSISAVAGLYRRARQAAATYEKELAVKASEERARQEREEILRRYELLAAESRDIILFIRRDDGRILEANPAASKAYGYSREELLALTFRDLRVAETEAQTADLIARVDTEGMLFETVHRRRDGSTFPVEVSSRGTTIGQTRALVNVVRDITERKQAEDALRESEARFRTLFEEEMNGILLADLDTQQLSLPNPQMCRMLGYSAEELQGLTVSSIHPAQDLPRIMEVFAKQCRGEIDLAPELPVLRKDGTIFYADISTKPVEVAGRRWLLGIFHDVTERKRAEDMLRLSRERAEVLLRLNQMTDASLQQIIDYALEEAVHITQSQIGYLAFLNDDESVLTMHSWSRNAMRECELATKPFVYVVNETGLWGEAVRQRRAIITNDYGAPSPWKQGYPEGHVHIRRHMNVPIFVGDHIVLVAGVGNKVAEYDETDVQQLTLLMDGMWRLIERTRAEETLRESKEQLRLAMESGQIGTFDWYPQTGQVLWSELTKWHFGLSADAYVDFDVFMAGLHPDDRPRLKQMIENVQRIGHDTDFAIEYRAISAKDGQERWVASLGRAHFNDQGQVVRFTGTAMDITERKQAEEQLKALNDTLEQRVADRTAEAQWRASQLQRLAGELSQVEQRERYRLAQILHDNLQQVLVAAKLNLDSLRRQLTDGEQRRFAQKVDELLGESLATSRSLTADLSPPILHEGSLAQALNWLARRAKEKHGLSVTVTAEGQADPASPDVRAMLFQAVRELLLNITKHAGVDQARLSLTRLDSEHIQILVADEGVGFDPEETRTEYAGTTLSSQFGLFSIRERLELMGGRMEIDSRPGHGTRVTLTAPCRLPGEEASPAGETVSEQPAEAGRAAERELPHEKKIIHVMLADDHAVVRDGLARLLQMQADMEIIGQAADGQEAVTLALQLRPEVVLMDVSMPRMSGVEATRRIIQQAPSIKIIGLSMHEKEDVAASMKTAGAAVYLTKTAPPEALIAAIRECTAREAVVE